MNIYKYGLNKENLIYMTECPVLEEKLDKNGIPMYDIQDGTKKKWLSFGEFEVYSNKVMYSFSPDAMDAYIENLKSHYARMAEDYAKKYENAKLSIKTILQINNLD